MSDWHKVSEISDRLLAELARPVTLNDREFSLTASLGIAVCPDDGEDGESLVHRADAAIIRAILGLARNLRPSLVAEGVETADQLAFLAAHGCDAAQGYYFSRPLPAEDWVELLGSAPVPGTELAEAQAMHARAPAPATASRPLP